MKTKTLDLTAVIIARNEDKMIAGCLQALDWVGEVVVVDNDSTDKTVSVARQYGAKVVKWPWKKFNQSEGRNLGLKNASGKWLFYVDADERITPELAKEITKEVEKDNQAYSAFAIPRQNFILGKRFKHGGQWPDYVKRLYKKDHLKTWQGQLHEEPVFTGQLGHLTNPMIHQKHETISEMVDKTNNWSEIEAGLMLEAHHPQMNILRFFSAALREFWLRMIKQLAFLDGPEGVIYALYQVFSRLVSYSKLWEMQLKKQNS